MTQIEITLCKSETLSAPYTKTDGLPKYFPKLNTIGIRPLEKNTRQVYKYFKNIQSRADLAIMYGTPKVPDGKMALTKVRRTGDNFTEEPIHLLTFDLDKYLPPQSEMLKHHRDGNLRQEHITTDIETFIKEELPPEFRDVQYFYRLSGSFLSAHKKNLVLRAHVCFVLEEPLYPREIGMFIKQQDIPADPTFYFNLTQVVFTAAPLWKDLPDPMQEAELERMVYVGAKEKEFVPASWKPIDYKYSPETKDFSTPVDVKLTGRVGAFCRFVPPAEILEVLDYKKKGDKWISPDSESGAPGVVVFDNGMIFSHHNEDMINNIVDKVYMGKRKALNSYDLWKGYATLYPEYKNDFDTLMMSACASDEEYLKEFDEDINHYLEWLHPEKGYDGDNRIIIDTTLADLLKSDINDLGKNQIFEVITAKTKLPRTKLDSVYRTMLKKKAAGGTRYSTAAGDEHNIQLVLSKNIIYPSRHTFQFWCYNRDTRVWMSYSRDQAGSYIADELNRELPVASSFEAAKIEILIRSILKHTSVRKVFQKSGNWGFKEGKTCIPVVGWYSTNGTGNWKPHIRSITKDDHVVRTLKVTQKEFERADPPKQFIKFLSDSLDEESRALLRQYVGYLFTGDVAFQKMLIIEGVPGSGKSVLQRILEDIVGFNNTSVSNFDSLGGQFSLAGVEDKALLLIPETRRLVGRKQQDMLSTTIPNLLKITGGDSTQLEAKYQDAYQARINAKIIIVANMLPTLPDDTGALSDRLMLIKMDTRFRGTDKEILGLDRIILEKELAGIYKWAFMGLTHLGKLKEFTRPKATAATLHEIDTRMNPLKNFIEDNCVIARDRLMKECISCKDFKDHFNNYLDQQGLGQVLSATRMVNSRTINALDKRISYNYQISSSLCGIKNMYWKNPKQMILNEFKGG